MLRSKVATGTRSAIRTRHVDTLLLVVDLTLTLANPVKIRNFI